MEPVRRWCLVTCIGPDGTVRGPWAYHGIGRPDLAAVDAIAHFALAAARRGERLVLDDVAPEMDELLQLAALPVQVNR